MNNRRSYMNTRERFLEVMKNFNTWVPRLQIL